jgi:hypothetical protein
MSKLKVILKGRKLKLFAVFSESTAYATAKVYIKIDLLLIFIHYYYTIVNPIGHMAKGMGQGPLTVIVSLNPTSGMDVSLW